MLRPIFLRALPLLAMFVTVSARLPSQSNDSLTLTNGNVLSGQIVLENEEHIVLRTSVGQIKLRRGDVAEIRRASVPPPVADDAKATPAKSPAAKSGKADSSKTAQSKSASAPPKAKAPCKEKDQATKPRDGKAAKAPSKPEKPGDRKGAAAAPPKKLPERPSPADAPKTDDSSGKGSELIPPER